jgi:hypothetical protein
MKSSLTVFANFFIDNEERFLRMKDSLQSIKGIKVDRYVVNVRGRFAQQVIDHLKSNVDKLHVFSIESYAGWFYDSSKFSHLISTNYVLLWVEDHICMASNKVNSVVNDMEMANADLLTYTFWCNGKFLHRYMAIEQTDAGSITWFDHTLDINDQVQNNIYGMKSYLISYPSIIKSDLFKKIIKDGGRERRWSRMTPFDFEKAPEDTHWLPLRRANPKFELFASIDDDQGEPGSCLEARGLYPKRLDRQTYTRSNLSFSQRLLSKISKPFVKNQRIVSNTFRSPFHYQRDYLISNLAPSKLNKYPLPDISYGAIDYLLTRISKILTVFEYGSGQSTLFWLANAKKVTSVEHDPSTYRVICTKISSMNCVDYRLIEPELDEINAAYKPSSTTLAHSADFIGYTFQKYVESIDDNEDEYLDVVFVNGRARPSCIAKSLSKIKPGGLLILNNSNREYYLQEAAPLLIGWNQEIFFGPVRGLLNCEQTTIFIKPIIL